MTTVEQLCDSGQMHLCRTDYLAARDDLMEAEQQAWGQKNWDALSRLYLPLQETRRQIRLRCAEGTVCLDLVAQGPDDSMDARHVIENYPQGQLLVAGWGTLDSALQTRRAAAEHGLYIETFLGAVYPASGGRCVVIAPWERALPAVKQYSIVQLTEMLPDCLVLGENELPAGPRPGSAQTFAAVSDLWQRLHQPLLDAAMRQEDALDRAAALRRVLLADEACELAHQYLADCARALQRRK